MNILPLLRPILPAVAATLLLGLPGYADDAPVMAHPALAELPEIEALEAPPVPEPRSLVFVGLGGLVLLAFALRRK